MSDTLQFVDRLAITAFPRKLTDKLKESLINLGAASVERVFVVGLVTEKFTTEAQSYTEDAQRKQYLPNSLSLDAPKASSFRLRQTKCVGHRHRKVI